MTTKPTDAEKHQKQKSYIVAGNDRRASRNVRCLALGFKCCQVSNDKFTWYSYVDVVPRGRVRRKETGKGREKTKNYRTSFMRTSSFVFVGDGVVFPRSVNSTTGRGDRIVRNLRATSA